MILEVFSNLNDSMFRTLLCSAHLPSLSQRQAPRERCWLGLAAGILAVPAPLDKTSL